GGRGCCTTWKSPPPATRSQRWCASRRAAWRNLGVWPPATARSLAPEIIKLYSKRWTIEPSFRDSKDLRFGMGMSALRIDDPQRRDRLLLLNAFATLLLTILGAAGESLGMDRQLRTSTVKRRVHSLFRQGCLLYDLILS